MLGKILLNLIIMLLPLLVVWLMNIVDESNKN
jgi:hypothetical protein